MQRTIYVKSMLALIVIILLCCVVFTPNYVHNAQSVTSSKPSFIKKNKFEGAKIGYVFKTENGITGYYKDIYKNE